MNGRATAYQQATGESGLSGIDLTDAVAEAVDVVQSLGVWARFAVNVNGASVVTCREAASKRVRLGSEGIPIWDELKTLLFRVQDGERSRIVAAHCRAHQDIDTDAVRCAVGGGSVVHLDEDQIATDYGMEKGRVTPFCWKAVREIEHLFDAAVLEQIGSAGTMMTNAGDRRWGIEFEPSGLLAALEANGRAWVGRGIAEAKADMPFMQSASQAIGILTGNAPESGILLWNRINRLARSDLDTIGLNAGDVGMPEVKVLSEPAMGVSMELGYRRAQTRSVVLDGVRSLCLSGARLIAIACNTTQVFEDELHEVCDKWGARFVSMPDALASSLARDGCDRIRFLGISYVTDLGGMSAYTNALSGVSVFPFEGQEQAMLGIAYDVKQGRLSKGLRELKSLLSHDDDSNTKGKGGRLPAVLALTELSIAIDLAQQKHERKLATNPDLPPLELESRRIYDTLGIYASEVVRHWSGRHGEKE